MVGKCFVRKEKGKGKGRGLCEPPENDVAGI